MVFSRQDRVCKNCFWLADEGADKNCSYEEGGFVAIMHGEFTNPRIQDFPPSDQVSLAGEPGASLQVSFEWVLV